MQTSSLICCSRIASALVVVLAFLLVIRSWRLGDIKETYQVLSSSKPNQTEIVGPGMGTISARPSESINQSNKHRQPTISRDTIIRETKSSISALASRCANLSCLCRSCQAWPASIFSANRTCPLYLEAVHEIAGMGHAFLSFNHIVTLAASNSLTLRAQYDTKRHKFMKPYFFGEIFFAKVTQPACHVTNVTRENVREMAQQARESCDRGMPKCIKFRINDPVPQSRHGLNVELFRRSFESKQLDRPKLIQRSKLLSSCRSTDSFVGNAQCITIALHIRRGDLFRYLGGKAKKSGERLFATVAELRFVHGVAYRAFLRKLVDTLRQDSFNTSVFRIIFFCEGMGADLRIRELDGSFTDMKRYFPEDHVKLLKGPKDALQSFDVMCHADVLITGTSGFSNIIATLCSGPVVLAVPLPYSYDCIPNALICNVSRTEMEVLIPVETGSPTNRTRVRLINHITFDENVFRHAFSTHLQENHLRDANGTEISMQTCVSLGERSQLQLRP